MTLSTYSEVNLLVPEEQVHFGNRVWWKKARTLKQLPRYEHSSCCRFLGCYGKYDLWYCTQGGDFPTVLARWSDEGPDYLSGLPSHSFRVTCPRHPRTVAYHRAKARGFIVERSCA